MNSISTNNKSVLPQREWCFETSAAATKSQKTAPQFGFAFAAADKTKAAAGGGDEQLQLKRLTAFGRSFTGQSWS